MTAAPPSFDLDGADHSNIGDRAAYFRIDDGGECGVYGGVCRHTSIVDCLGYGDHDVGPGPGPFRRADRNDVY